MSMKALRYFRILRSKDVASEDAFLSIRIKALLSRNIWFVGDQVMGLLPCPLFCRQILVNTHELGCLLQIILQSKQYCPVLSFLLS
jgi:hypothetical protein